MAFYLDESISWEEDIVGGLGGHQHPLTRVIPQHTTVPALMNQTQLFITSTHYTIGILNTYRDCVSCNTDGTIHRRYNAYKCAH